MSLKYAVQQRAVEEVCGPDEGEQDREDRRAHRDRKRERARGHLDVATKSQRSVFGNSESCLGGPNIVSYIAMASNAAVI